MKALISTLSIFVLLGLAACSPAVTGDGGGDPKNLNINAAGAEDGFPGSWLEWAKITDKVVVRKERARAFTLHHNGKGGGGQYPDGTVLVKAEHELVGTAKGALLVLSVMRKTAGAWSYESFLPGGKRHRVDSDVCQMCHIQRQENDFVFSDF